MKNPIGRPTKYKEEYCNKVIEWMAEGQSKVEVCANIGIYYDTFLSWQEKFPEFLESVKRGEKLCEAWWERLGRQGATCERDINPTTWIFNMKNRFNWSDKVDASVKPGKDKDGTTPEFKFVVVK